MIIQGIDLFKSLPAGSEVSLLISREFIEKNMDILNDNISKISAYLKEISRICLEYDIYDKVYDILNNIFDGEIYVALPHIVKEANVEKTERLVEKALSKGIRNFLIRNLDSLVILKEKDENPDSLTLMADHNLYSMNTYSMDFLREQGISYFTAPLEENYHELKERGMEDTEVLVYGNFPLMVSEQCVMKTMGRCGKTRILELHDRYSKNFKVVGKCEFCYNLIYNSVPLSLVDMAEELEEMGASSLRISLTFEKLRLDRDGNISMEDGDFTRGHFKKSVK